MDLHQVVLLTKNVYEHDKTTFQLYSMGASNIHLMMYEIRSSSCDLEFVYHKYVCYVPQ